MTRNEAVQILQNGADQVSLAKAIGTVAADDSAPLDALRLGLRYGGLVAEQAALCLYRRLGWRLPTDRTRVVVDAETWDNILQLQARCERATAGR